MSARLDKTQLYKVVLQGYYLSATFEAYYNKTSHGIIHWSNGVKLESWGRIASDGDHGWYVVPISGEVRLFPPHSNKEVFK
jgi:hypothetical protein